MNSLSFFLLFFLIEIGICAKPTKNPSNVIRIPLTSTSAKSKKNNSAGARSAILLDDYTALNYGTVTVGTYPSKKDFKVVFDTGSPHLWLFSYLYSACELNTPSIRAHTVYDGAGSSTNVFHKTEKPELFSYGTGWVFGFWNTDLVSMAGNQIRKKFLEVVMASDSMLEAAYDGIVGLSYDPEQGNIVTKLCESVKGENQFSFYLPKNKSSRSGELWLCGEDTSKYVAGTMKYVSEAEPGTWQIKIDKAQLEGPQENVLLASQFKAKIDTGTNRINAPNSIIEKIYEILQATPLENSPAKQVDCNNVQNLPNLTFTIDGTNYVLTGTDYTRKEGYSFGLRCRLLLRKKTSGNYWTIGDVFIRKYYTVFDMKNHRIGIATSNG